MLSFVNMLVIGITSRALFDLDESHGIFEDKGLQAYKDFQVGNENIPLNPGAVREKSNAIQMSDGYSQIWWPAPGGSGTEDCRNRLGGAEVDEVFPRLPEGRAQRRAGTDRAA